jgi:hypothetical protein
MLEEWMGGELSRVESSLSVTGESGHVMRCLVPPHDSSSHTPRFRSLYFITHLLTNHLPPLTIHSWILLCSSSLY